MTRREQVSGYCMLCAAILLVSAAVEFTAPVTDCELKSLEWALWLCLALGFAGAGFSKRRLCGAAIGTGLVLVPLSVVELFDDFGQFLAVLPFVAILAAVIYHAIIQTIRGQ